MTGDSGWIRHDAASRRISLTLHVQPGAKRSGIVGPHGDALKIRIAAPAVDNKANAALVEFLGKVLDVPKSAITIRHGTTGRRKVIEITGGEEMAKRAAALAAS